MSEHNVVESTAEFVLRGHMIVMSMTILAWDYAITFNSEVDVIWSRSWTFGTLLFALNRYLPFIDLAISVNTLQRYIPEQRCLNLTALVTWLQLAGICIAEVILVLRTIAIWKRNRYVAIGLSLVFVAGVASASYITTVFLGSLRFSASPVVVGCHIVDADEIFFLDYVVILICETVIVALTVIRAVYHLRHSTSFWVYQLYQRGVLFYIFLLSITLLNVIFPLLAPVGMKTVFSDLQRILHSVCCNRVIFLIFSQQNPHRRATAAAMMSSNGTGYRHTRTVLPTVLDTFMTSDYVEDTYQ